MPHHQHRLTKTYDLSSVRCCVVAAAPLSAELTEELLRVLPDTQLGQGYGACSPSLLSPAHTKSEWSG